MSLSCEEHTPDDDDDDEDESNELHVDDEGNAHGNDDADNACHDDDDDDDDDDKNGEKLHELISENDADDGSRLADATASSTLTKILDSNCSGQRPWPCRQK